MNTSALTLSNTNDSSTLTASIDLAGRIGLAAIFLLAGLNKIQHFDGNAQYMTSAGLPEFLLPAVIVLEIVGAAFIIAGFQLRITALILAGFTALTALMFHNNLADQIQFLMFFKNIAIAGGFLVLAAHGAGRFSLDARL